MPSTLVAYRPLRRVEWRQRLLQARTRIGEISLHAAALAAGLVLGMVLLDSRREEWAGLVQWIIAQVPFAALVILALLAGLEHAAAQRRLRRAWQRDWFRAQPITRAERRYEALRAWSLRLAWQAVLAAAGLWLARLDAAASLAALVALGTGAAVGAAAAIREPRARLQPRRHEVPFLLRGRGSLSRWQWIEASAALAPRQLAWLLPALLLVPRGGWRMALVALLLLVVLAFAAAWRRSVAVIPRAQPWLALQPVPPGRWLARSAVVPLCVLLPAVALFALAMLAAGQARVALLALLLVPPALLQLAVVMAERRNPARAAFGFALHTLLLAAVAQSFAPVALVLWGLQLFWLWRRAARA